MSRLVAFLYFASIAAWAQTATGTIEGRVIDPTGGIIPDAKVVIQNQGTNVRQELTTNSAGGFVQPFLQPGEYLVAVEKEGFRKYSQSNVRVNVQQTVSLEISLPIGETSNTVEVVAGTAQLSVASSTVSTVIGNKAIMELPLNDRNPFNLATLSPGVVPGGNGSSTPWISGGRNASSEVTIDGTSVILPENNVGVNALAYTPPVDSVQEFSIVTNALSAEYGRTGGGTINVSTKSGTNDIHGSAFEFLRNSQLDANNFFSNRGGIQRGAFQRNQFGGTIGGPVVLPGYDGRNRTFFFVSEQSTLQRSANVFTTTVPTEEWKNGNFSNLRNASGQPMTIYDPSTVSVDPNGNYLRQPFANNSIPVNRMDSVARNLLQYYPTPNANPTNIYTNANNFSAAGKDASNQHQFDIRLDHSFSSKWTVFGRGSYSHSEGTPYNAFGNIATPNTGGPSSTDNYNIALNSNYTISPTTILNVSYGFGRFFVASTPFSRGFDMTTLGLPSSIRDVATTQALEFPRFNVSGVTALGQPTYTSLRFVPNSHVVSGSLTKVFSKHTVKFGAEYRKMLLNFLQLGRPDGEYSFDQSFTQQNPATSVGTQGFGFASFLLGTPTTGAISHDPTPASASSYTGFYVQDDFKATSRLTLNFGLRYDIDFPRTERYNRYSYFDINAPSPIAGQVPGYSDLRGAMQFVTPDNRQQVPTDLNNFSPRFGFAYKATDKTVVRGAYALMYAGSMMQAAGSSGSAGMEGYRSTTNMITSLDGGRTPYAFLNNPFPDGFNLPLGSANGPISGASTNLGLGVGESYFNDWRNPVIQQWNFNLQRELPWDMIVEVGYLGSKGNHLVDGEGSMAYNQLPASYGAYGNALNNLVENPFYGIITNPNSPLSKPTVAHSQLLRAYPQYTSIGAFRKPQANSLYHSFLLRVEKRFSSGLGFLLSYTGGKLIDDASQTVTFLGQAGNKQDFYNRKAERAVSAQDVSSRLVLSSNYDLPFGEGRKMLNAMNPVAEAFIGGWQVNGILTFATGTPVIVTQNVNNTYLGSNSQRPTNNGQSAAIDGGSKDSRIAQWFDTSAFSFTPSFQFGNSPRTLPDVRNPGVSNLDFSLFKNFAIRERTTIQFRAEAFNLTNTAQFAAPNAQLGSGSFGVISSTAASPRQVQLALRLRF